jgi:hypothetical protein
MPASGAAVGDISPQTTLALAGRGGSPRIALPTPQSLEVNALVLQAGNSAAAVVAVDTLFCSASLVQAVKKNLGKAAKTALGEAIFLIASHSHNAPSLDPSKPMLGSVDETYFQQSAQTIANTIEIALANSRPITAIDMGKAKCNANARRRSKALRIVKRPPFLTRGYFTLPSHEADVPRDFEIQIAQDENGSPLWAMWSWPCHATAFPQGNSVNADFPGEVRRLLRKQLNAPDLPIAFLPGISGDLRSDASPSPVPLWKRLMTPFARPFAETTLENFLVLCGALAKVSEQAISTANRQQLGVISFWHANKTMPLKLLMPSTTCKSVIGMSFLSFGPVNLFMIGTEMCSPWIKVLIPKLPPGTVLTGYCNDVPCYLPTDRQVLEGGYEVSGWRGSFQTDGSFTTGLEAKITSALQELLT